MARRTIGTPPLSVTLALPESAEAVAARVRDARAGRTPLRITAARQWLDAGRPCHTAGELSLAALRGVTEYERGDFTITMRAATPLAEIDAVTAREGQWLALQPFGSADGTIGATIATASWGPLASAYGTPRDQLLGCEVVTGVGEVIRAGGRVVKNVAGFDLTRLMTGAWGTLGVITDVTLRLRARPEVDRTLVVVAEGGADAFCSAAWQWLRASPYAPLAAELCSAALATRLGLEGGGEGRPLLLVRLGGNEAFVRAAEESVAALGATTEVSADVWARLRTLEPAGSTVVRLGALPSTLGAVWSAVSDVVERSGGWTHATLERGVIRCVVPTADGTQEESARIRGIIDQLNAPGSRVVERLPAPLWEAIAAPAGDRLSSAVRRTFDPDGVLNPGILAPLS
ncbi:MAG: FAD-binding protein [Gemmatimonadetes bacterium]|nr:FAD-binding protein [Gemmatimonadota bacterium]